MDLIAMKLSIFTFKIFFNYTDNTKIFHSYQCYNDPAELQLHVHLATIDRENERNLSIMQPSRNTNPCSKYTCTGIMERYQWIINVIDLYSTRDDILSVIQFIYGSLESTFNETS